MNLFMMTLSCDDYAYPACIVRRLDGCVCV
jgi:hypothetical protein